jgi:exopolysaccharide biosynthesis polyprenyl glycosylphosphotransferase
MESSTVNHKQGQTGVGALPVEPRAQQILRRDRGAVLAKMLFLGDSISAAVAAAATVAILGAPSPQAAVLSIAIVTLVYPLVGFAVGLYRSDMLALWASAVNEVPRGTVTLILISWPVFALHSIVGIEPATAATVITVGILVLCAVASRTIIRTALHRRENLRQRTLILGSGLVAGQLVEKIRNNNQFGLDPVGIVDEQVYSVGTPDLPRLGGFGDLHEIIEAQNIDRVIIAFSKVRHEELLEAIRSCRDAGIAVDVVPRLFEFLDGVRSLDQIGGLPLLSIGVPILSSSMVAAKRALDIAGSLALILLFSPIMLATAIAIKINSPGPVFFLQDRAGRRNKRFRLIKFRSMYVDADRRKAEFNRLNEAQDGVMFKIRDDPRVTSVGRFVRRYSVDELPQLFNVLKGDMSLVGPRPLIFDEAEALEERWHLRRIELRPGITGPWQVYGRSQSPFQEMIRFDYQYVAGWSLARDIELLLETLPAVMSGRGAY